MCVSSEALWLMCLPISRREHRHDSFQWVLPDLTEHTPTSWDSNLISAWEVAKTLKCILYWHPQTFSWGERDLPEKKQAGSQRKQNAEVWESTPTPKSAVSQNSPVGHICLLGSTLCFSLAAVSGRGALLLPGSDQSGWVGLLPSAPAGSPEPPGLARSQGGPRVPLQRGSLHSSRLCPRAVTGWHPYGRSVWKTSCACLSWAPRVCLKKNAIMSLVRSCI